MGAAIPDADLSNPLYYQSFIFTSAYHNPRKIYIDFCSFQVRALIPELHPDNWKVAWKSGTKEGKKVNLKICGTSRMASKQAILSPKIFHGLAYSPQWNYNQTNPWR